MFWARVDNRLIHGQIIESWLPYTGAKLLVVADDPLAEDPLRQEIMSMAIPRGVTPAFTPISGLVEWLHGHAPGNVQSTAKDGPASEACGHGCGGADSGSWPNALVLFADCTSAKAAYQGGLRYSGLNIGNLHYAEGKRQVLAHVALSSEDESCLNFLQHQGVALDFRCVPNERVHLNLPLDPSLDPSLGRH